MTVPFNKVNDDEDVDEHHYGCYLLLSLDAEEAEKPLARRRTYIGSTYDFDRRVNQHNRFRSGGAKKTESKGPWIAVCTVTGFATRRDALQFEWAWQHPAKTTFLKKVRKQLKAQDKPKLPPHGSNLRFALRGLRAMVQAWQHDELQVDWHSAEVLQLYRNLFNK